MGVKRRLDRVRLEPSVSCKLSALLQVEARIGPRAHACVPEQHRTNAQVPDVVPAYGREPLVANRLPWEKHGKLGGTLGQDPAESVREYSTNVMIVFEMEVEAVLVVPRVEGRALVA